MQSTVSSTKGRTAVLRYLPTPDKVLAAGQNVLSAMGTGESPAVNAVESFVQESSIPQKRAMPGNGKKTKGRVKIKMEFIDNKLRRYTTFSKRKTGIMKKAYELSTLTGTQVMLLVASETGHVYTFATRKLQPMITSEAGKALIQTCLNSPDPPPGPGSSGLDQRMSATGFEETDLTYSVGEECEKVLDIQCKGGYSSSPEMSPVSGSSTPTVQIGTFHSDSECTISSALVGNSPPVYRMPAQTTTQPYSIAISGSSKNESSLTSNSSGPQQNTISLIQNHQQNLSVVSGNVVIPAAQTLLQSANNSGNNSVQSTFMYQTAQGLVYATPTSLPEGGVIFNIGQEQGGATTQQYITIPVPLSLNPAQQQLLQVSSATTVPTNCQVQACTHVKKGKSRK